MSLVLFIRFIGLFYKQKYVYQVIWSHGNSMDYNVIIFAENPTKKKGLYIK